MSIAALYPSEAAIQLMIFFKAGRRPMLHGDPGVGKSQMVQQVADLLFAEKYGYSVAEDGSVYGPASKAPVAQYQKPWYKEIRAAQYDAVDLRGLYDIETDKKGKKITKWIRPEDLPSDPRGGVIFLDEINRGQEIVQNALFQLLDQYCIGPHDVPTSWHMCAAVNDKDGGTRKLSTALQLRFSHIDVIPYIDDVLAIAKKRKWNPMVIAFLRFRPELLHKYEPNQRSSPNSRGWEFTSQVVTEGDVSYSHLSAQRKANMQLALVAAQLGEAVAVELCGFMRLWASLPSIDSIETSPDTAIVPTEPSALYATCGAISRYITLKNASKLFRYINRLPAEFAVACVEFATARDSGIKAAPAYGQWAITNHSIML